MPSTRNCSLLLFFLAACQGPPGQQPQGVARIHACDELGWRTIAPFGGQGPAVASAFVGGAYAFANGVAERYIVAEATWTDAPAPPVTPERPGLLRLADESLLMVDRVGDSESHRLPKGAAAWEAAGVVTAPVGVLLAVDEGAVSIGGERVAHPFVEEWADGTWTTVASLSDARRDHFAILLADGRVLVGGGRGEAVAGFASTEIVDLETGDVEPGPLLREARSEASTVRLADGRIMVAGGRNRFGEPLATTELFSLRDLSFRAGPPLAHARADFDLRATRDGGIVAWGGRDSDDELVTESELFTLREETWLDAGGVVLPRELAGVAPLRNGQLLVVAGQARANVPLVTELFCPPPKPEI